MRRAVEQIGMPGEMLAEMLVEIILPNAIADVIGVLIPSHRIRLQRRRLVRRIASCVGIV
jgi:hypothetical protein